MPGPRLVAAALTAAAFGSTFATASPAHAVLDACVAKVSISGEPTVGLGASVTATLDGSCPTAIRNDEIVCTLVLAGASTATPPAPVVTKQVIGRVIDGCSVSVSIPNAVQNTPYVAVGTVETADVTFPGADAAAVVP